jgi:prepilin-type processing-associated H-X9-DG protein
VGVIHCPGDTRFKFNAPGRGWAYDSYSKPESIAGETYNNWWGQGSTYTKLAAISAPSDTFAFVEDVDSRGYNVGTWTLNWQATTAQAGHPQSFTWEDPLPMYHGNVSTFAFADGHAEAHTWGDGALINFGKLVAAGGAIGNQPNPPNYRTADYEYIYQGFRFPTWQQ